MVTANHSGRPSATRQAIGRDSQQDAAFAQLEAQFEAIAAVASTGWGDIASLAWTGKDVALAAYTRAAQADASEPPALGDQGEAAADYIRALLDVGSLAASIDDAIDYACQADGGHPIEGTGLHVRILALLTAIRDRVEHATRGEANHGN